jgi:phosphomevalonate kinase
MIRARAPGKVVLWGEYAVLTGAPALVMAVDRYAECTVAPGDDVWRFEARGFQAPAAAVPRERLLSREPPAADAVWHTTWHVLQELPRSALRRLPAGGRLRSDSRSFHHRGTKLGLGSSAAVCVATCGALCRLLDQPLDYATALAIHGRTQGQSGSGIDVAAAWHGGTLRFQRPHTGEPGCATPWPLPPGLHPVFVWSGRAARTPDHLSRFWRWLDADRRPPLDALAERAAALFEAGDGPADVLSALTAYVGALEHLDAAAKLGIYSDGHRTLRRLASQAGVVYKPCGAGGGDLGAAFAAEPAAADRFAALATDHGFLPVALEIAPHGIEVTG